MNKACWSARQAVADIPDGASLAVSGFGLSGIPNNLIEVNARDTLIRSYGRRYCVGV